MILFYNDDSIILRTILFVANKQLDQWRMEWQLSIRFDDHKHKLIPTYLIFYWNNSHYSWFVSYILLRMYLLFVNPNWLI
jgi:hypothetical protein